MISFSNYLLCVATIYIVIILTGSADDPDNKEMLNTMIRRAKALTAKECLGMVRCMSTALSLVNAAEVQHRLRSIKRHELETGDVFPGPLYHTEDSVKGSIQALLKKGEATPDEVWDQLCTQQVERKWNEMLRLSECHAKFFPDIVRAFFLLVLDTFCLLISLFDSRFDGPPYRSQS